MEPLAQQSRGQLGVAPAGVMEVVDRFFFSSRRRHTRFDCDWSSDVCSSDLDGMGFSFRRKIRRLLRKAFASSSAARRYVRRWLRTAESFTRIALLSIDSPRSEERRVGKECRSRWSPYH